MFFQLSHFRGRDWANKLISQGWGFYSGTGSAAYESPDIAAIQYCFRFLIFVPHFQTRALGMRVRSKNVAKYHVFDPL